MPSMIQVLVQVPDEATLHRLLVDGAPIPEVAREPRVYVVVIRDGDVQPYRPEAQ